MNTNILGIFDSGLGGLTVVRSLMEQMPHQPFIYIGDNAHRPYGAKSPEEIARLSVEIGRYLQARGVDMIVVACNTASSAALEKLRASVNIPVIGIIDAGVQATVDEVKKLNLLPLINKSSNDGCSSGNSSYRNSVSRFSRNSGNSASNIGKQNWNSSRELIHNPTHNEADNLTDNSENKTLLKIGVLATVATVRSNIYKREIEKTCPYLCVIQQAAPRLEEIVETRIFQHTTPDKSIASDEEDSQDRAILSDQLTPSVANNMQCFHNQLSSDTVGDALNGSKKRFIYGRYFSQEEINTFKKDILQVVEPLIREDVSFIVLGCTHFPIMADLIQEVIRENNKGVSIPLVDPAAHEVQEVKHYIEQHPKSSDARDDNKLATFLSCSSEEASQVQEFLTTAHNVPKFRTCIRNILKEENPAVYYVSLNDYEEI